MLYRFRFSTGIFASRNRRHACLYGQCRRAGIKASVYALLRHTRWRQGAGSVLCARAETLATAPAFRGPYKTKRRCLVPACGFYEWQKGPAGKTPYYITSADESLLAFAGVWDVWKTPDGATLTTFTVITKTPNELTPRLHDRMPVILKPDDYRAGRPAELLRPCPVEMLQCYLVSACVNPKLP